jgi:integral membrane protein (TIGR01906 family)
LPDDIDCQRDGCVPAALYREMARHDEEETVSRFVTGLMRWAVVLAMPVFLLLSAARILINDWYPTREYAKPNFPLDTYGWSQQQRLSLALVSIHFLNSPESPEKAVALLAAQRKPENGQLLFTAAELSHMVDVKRLTDALWRVHLIAAALTIGGLAWLWARRRTRTSGWWTLMAGGLFTAVLLAVLALLVLVSWRTFFIQFHEIFFTEGSWTFDWSDSLIRLFPDMLWFDAGAGITIGTFLSGILLFVAGRIGWRVSQRPAPQ